MKRMTIEFASLDLVKCCNIILKVMKKDPAISPHNRHIISCNAMSPMDKDRFLRHVMESNIRFEEESPKPS